MQTFAPAVDVTFVGQFSQHAIEGSPVSVLGAERAGDLAHSYLAAPLSDEGQELLARGQFVAFHSPLIGRVFGQGRIGSDYSAACLVALRGDFLLAAARFG